MAQSFRGLPLQKIPQGWRASDIPNLEGKRFLVTGGTSGLGREIARELARAGAQTIITGRSQEKISQTIDEISRHRVIGVELDLADLESVRRAARQIDQPVDVLILNAGIMAVPENKTRDDFELQLGTNHLGHFAFAGLLREKVTERIVSVSSQAHRTASFGSGTIEELTKIARGENSYSPWGAYSASKLANLLFAFELQRRSKNWKFQSFAAHPGYSNTNLQSVGPKARGSHVEERLVALSNSLIAQSARLGALPILCAATFPHLYGGSYIGPDGLLEMRGYPKATRARAIAYDQILAQNLWHVSEELTGVYWR
jgi:NAD(P)-dependent dehydrogenase (short-subunit alcohol dehydrogenase family)